jgi:hypothetical protein
MHGCLGWWTTIIKTPKTPKMMHAKNKSLQKGNSSAGVYPSIAAL